MKTLMVIAGIGLFAGCGHKPDARDVKLAELEARLSFVETNYADLNQHYSDTMALTKKLLDEGLGHSDELIAKTEAGLRRAELMAADLRESWNSLTNLVATEAKKPHITYTLSATPQQQSVVRNYVRMVNGVPAPIYDKIGEKAQEDWPNDFRMQVYVIKNQVEAYRKLHP